MLIQYLVQYAHTRIRSILRKAGDPQVTVDPSVALHPAERTLALELDDFGNDPGGGRRDVGAAQAVWLPVRPRPRFHHVLRGVPGAQRREPTRGNRLALCQLTARTLRHGLELLGISAPERM